MDGKQGGTAATQDVFIGHVGIPTRAAVPQAVQALQEMGSRSGPQHSSRPATTTRRGTRSTGPSARPPAMTTTGSPDATRRASPGRTRSSRPASTRWPPGTASPTTSGW
ncbi:MAG: glutamate synthase-related protein [Janthinobacterium lividum]